MDDRAWNGETARRRAAGRGRLSKHPRPRAVGDDAVLEMPLDSARQDETLDVATDADEVGARVAVADAGGVLLDDGPGVEEGRHVVRGRADHLDTALERAVVRARSGERRQ